ncbi:uncharacterized protein EV420DRAFT_1485906 [Desarmillaria tabescens]|uniref:Uncharacterized protein n=1 Tax=Armillaria tabescens TaxID=1929756 RepID=A0AA39JEP5_ARMTA|nr:uncharacterized protein EV420DRAFT_1485906 [Desarmillaria tabescens]KAK0440697.1 hypothetical protein EV420DRAFT_1485906 [Desarmillaria tabescens]
MHFQNTPSANSNRGLRLNRPRIFKYCPAKKVLAIDWVSGGQTGFSASKNGNNGRLSRCRVQRPGHEWDENALLRDKLGGYVVEWYYAMGSCIWGSSAVSPIIFSDVNFQHCNLKGLSVGHASRYPNMLLYMGRVLGPTTGSGSRHFLRQSCRERAASSELSDSTLDDSNPFVGTHAHVEASNFNAAKTGVHTPASRNDINAIKLPENGTENTRLLGSASIPGGQVNRKLGMVLKAFSWILIKRRRNVARQ